MRLYNIYLSHGTPVFMLLMLENEIVLCTPYRWYSVFIARITLGVAWLTDGKVEHTRCRSKDTRTGSKDTRCRTLLNVIAAHRVNIIITKAKRTPSYTLQTYSNFC